MSRSALFLSWSWCITPKTTKIPVNRQGFWVSIFNYSSIMTIQLNTPLFAEKRQEPLCFSADDITLCTPMPCKYSGISSKLRDSRQVFSQEITKRPALCLIETVMRGFSALLSMAPWRAFSKMFATMVTSVGDGTEISGFAAARISIVIFCAVAFC